MDSVFYNAKAGDVNSATRPACMYRLPLLPTLDAIRQRHPISARQIYYGYIALTGVQFNLPVWRESNACQGTPAWCGRTTARRPGLSRRACDT